MPVVLTDRTQVANFEAFSRSLQKASMAIKGILVLDQSHIIASHSSVSHMIGAFLVIHVLYKRLYNKSQKYL